jgi:MFS superfamily sulfate permease-like transporter
VLGAIVFSIAVRMIDLRGLLSIRQESPGEYTLAWITAVTVVVAGVEQGIVLAMVLSLLRIVRHSYQPHTSVLVRGEGDTWHSAPPVPGTVTEPGLVMYRFGAAIFYANARRFSDGILALIEPAPTTVRWLVVDAEAVINLDYTAARVVRELHEDLARRGVVLAFARLPLSLQADFDRHGVTAAVGRDHLFHRLHDGLAAYERAYQFSDRSP